MALIPLIQVLLIPTVITAVYLARTEDPTRRARFLRTEGAWFLGVYFVLGLLFAAGETLTDPGGWRGFAMIAMWLVPVMALTRFAWRRPDAAGALLAFLLVGVVLLQLAVILSRDLQDLIDRVGPFDLMAVFALIGPSAVLGWRKDPGRAGRMLLVLAVAAGAPFTTVSFNGGIVTALAGVGLITAPVIIGGILYLWSSSNERRGPPLPTRSMGEFGRAA